MSSNRKGTEEFATAMHLLLGTILFTVIAIAVIFFFVGEDITAIFTAGTVDVDKIATRIIFSKDCLALEESFDFTIWYGPSDYRRNGTLVRAGIIDTGKFNPAKISSCVGYSLTNYAYKLTYKDLENGNTGTINPNSMSPLNCSKRGQVLINKTKIYPVLIDAVKHNGVLTMTLAFCYRNESAVDLS